MIAPVREDRPASAHRSRGLTMARRAVAAALLNRSDQPPARSGATAYVSWALIAWVLAVTASYFAFWSWWTIEGY